MPDNARLRLLVAGAFAAIIVGVGYMSSANIDHTSKEKKRRCSSWWIMRCGRGASRT